MNETTKTTQPAIYEKPSVATFTEAELAAAIEALGAPGMGGGLVS